MSTEPEPAFDPLLKDLLADLFALPLGGAGCTLESLAAAEARLGVPLPRTLRRCYEIAGQHPALSCAQQNLLAPADLGLRSFMPEGSKERLGGLVFLREQQGVTYSVIRRDDLGKPDPPVFQGNHEEDTLYPDWQSLSTFLLSTVCWNAMELNVSGRRSGVGKGEYDRVRMGLRRIQCGPARPAHHTEAYWRDSFAACVFRTSRPGRFDLHVSARTDGELRAFEAEFGIALAWN